MSLSNEDIQQLISILQRGLTQDQSDDIVEEPRKPKTKKTRKSTQQTSEKSNNKFDTMMEKSMHKEDIAIDKKLAKHAPSVRAREFAKMKVSCRVCGKTEEVIPSLVYEGRYKCNKCAKEPG